MDIITNFAAPALTGLFSGLGAVIALKVDVTWLKKMNEELRAQVNEMCRRVSRLEGKNKHG